MLNLYTVQHEIQSLVAVTASLVRAHRVV